MVSRKQPAKGHATPKPTVDVDVMSRERMNRASADFLKIDLETALTFAQIARETTDVARKERNREAARRAYSVVTRMMERVKLSDEEVQTLAVGLEQLRSELQDLGEAL